MPLTEQELFHAACALPPGAEVAAFLREQCPDDAALRARVAELIALATEVDDVLPEPADEAWGGAFEKAGDVVGHYRLEERIGQGGFGTVWRAAQEAPVRREVAVKILKAGMDTRAALARFDTERQALARMDHPNVARIYDAGSTPQGRPYFVMELIRGEALPAWAVRVRLGLRERVRLIAQAAGALQHAHQKGIIHRDLKPSNLLVVEGTKGSDDGPQVKVIDFGIARMVEEPAGMTLTGHRWGTPAWMSPEQLNGEPVDTRTDIFSLGLTLYELLSGVPPRRMKAPEPADTTLVAPSRAVTRMDDATRSTHAGNCGSNARQLPSLLRGELDWIVLKAAAHEPAQRYESAGALRDDLLRYLNGEAVLAGPLSWKYRAGKFMRKHKGALAAAAALVLTLAGAAVVSLVYARRATVAQEQTQEALHRALLTEARALTQTGRIGQRLGALDAIARAAAIRPTRALQDEAVAAMALPDLREIARITVPDPTYPRWYHFDRDVLIRRPLEERALRPRRVLTGEELPAVPLPLWSAFGDKIALHPRMESVALWLQGRLPVPGLDGSVAILEYSSGKVWGNIPGAEMDEGTPVYFADGTRLAVIMQAGGVALCDARTGAVQRTVLAGLKCRAVVASDHQQLLLITSGGGRPSAHLVPYDDGEPVPVPIATGQVPALSADGRLGVVSSGAVLCAFDPRGILQGEEPYTANRPGHRDMTDRIHLAGGSQFVLTSGWDDRLKISTPAQETRLSSEGAILGATADGSRVLIRSGKVIRLMEVVLPEECPAVSEWAAMASRNSSFSPDGKFAAISSRSQKSNPSGVPVPDSCSGTLLLRLPGLEPIAKFGSQHVMPTFAGDGSLWTSHYGLSRWDTSEAPASFTRRLHQPRQTLLKEWGTKSPVLTADGAQIAARIQQESGSPFIGVWRTADGSELFRKAGPDGCGDAQDIVLDPQGRWLAVSWWRGEGFQVWSLPDGKVIASGSAGFENVRLCLSHDGGHLLASDLGGIHLWKTADWTSRQLATVTAPALSPAYIGISADGNVIAWEDAPGTVQVMRREAAAPALTLRIPSRERITSIAVSPAGETIAVGTLQDTWFYDLPKVRAHLARLGLGSVRE